MHIFFLLPLRKSSIAVKMPAGPAPTIQMSYFFILYLTFRLYADVIVFLFYSCRFERNYSREYLHARDLGDYKAKRRICQLFPTK